MSKILIADDEKSIRQTLREILEFEGFKVDEARDGAEALEKASTGNFGVVLCDIRMPRLDGIEVLKKSLEKAPETQFVMISAHGTIDTAVEATKLGAFDFLQKPPDLNRLLLTIRNAQERFRLLAQNNKLKEEAEVRDEIIGHSPSLLRILDEASKVALTDARVLITGPNGSGKELLARAIHKVSNRKDGPIVIVNCAAIPSELIESELFGHEKGSFTGAFRQHTGKFEQANSGTLFLDEIGDMSLSAQAKVLRALQENTITRVGGDREIEVDVRLVAATNKDLKTEIALGNFREDLYHRLSVIILHMPSLAERSEDIPVLIKHFMQGFAKQYGKSIKTFAPEAMNYLTNQPWTGNIRELRNAVERLFILAENPISLTDVKRYVG